MHFLSSNGRLLVCYTDSLSLRKVTIKSLQQFIAELHQDEMNAKRLHQPTVIFLVPINVSMKVMNVVDISVYEGEHSNGRVYSF